jgi:hypothetical protein
MKMKVIRSSETWTKFYQVTWCHISDESTLQVEALGIFLDKITHRRVMVDFSKINCSKYTHGRIHRVF